MALTTGRSTPWRHSVQKHEAKLALQSRQKFAPIDPNRKVRMTHERLLAKRPKLAGVLPQKPKG